MGEIQNLREQVRKLKSRLDQIEGTPSSKVVSEIVGTADETRSRSGNFSAACQQSRVNMIREQILKATDELSNNPGILTSTVGEEEFRQHYGTIPQEDLNQIIAMAKRGP